MTDLNEQAALISYRLPPSHRKVRAGCWSTGILILLSLALLGCGLADAVQKVAEPIDKAGCQADCEREEMEFSSYDYHPHKCFCIGRDGNIITLY